jgi:PAS domain S-box-containing protein
MARKFDRPDWVQQMEQVLETVNEGVLIADAGRRIVFVNAGFVRMTGLRPEDLVGNAVQLFYSDEEWASLEKKIEEMLQKTLAVPFMHRVAHDR